MTTELDLDQFRPHSDRISSDTARFLLHCRDHDYDPCCAVQDALTFCDPLLLPDHESPLPPCLDAHIRSLLGDHPTDCTYQDLLDDICDAELYLRAALN